MNQSLAIIREALDADQVVAREVTHGHQTLDAENEEVRRRPAPRDTSSIGVRRNGDARNRPSIAPDDVQKLVERDETRSFACFRRVFEDQIHAAHRIIQSCPALTVIITRHD